MQSDFQGLYGFGHVTLCIVCCTSVAFLSVSSAAAAAAGLTCGFRTVMICVVVVDSVPPPLQVRQDAQTVLLRAEQPLRGGDPLPAPRRLAQASDRLRPRRLGETPRLEGGAGAGQQTMESDWMCYIENFRFHFFNRTLATIVSF